jgi:polypeptide N-acetylgalactosaminyltransferase
MRPGALAAILGGVVLVIIVAGFTSGRFDDLIYSRPQGDLGVGSPVQAKGSSNSAATSMFAEEDAPVIDRHMHGELARQAARNVFPGADAEHLHGRIGLSPNGAPAWIPSPPLTSETEQEKREHHRGHCFNVRQSDSIPLDRPIADARHASCLSLTYSEDLPVASVIMIFYNEPASSLYRSLHSILNRTPPRLLHEIVLVDDFSDADHLQAPQLEDYLRTLPKVKLIRLTRRSGIMAARNHGVKASSGEVLVFMDSHIECGHGWLEPLLARINEDRKHVVMPAIDTLDPDTLAYSAGGLDVLAFSWRMSDISLSRPRVEPGPWPSVSMPGGLFAISRYMFIRLGGYDPEMQIYGGEEIELSFRIWQCGMTLECLPCSRVAHIFRTNQYWQGQVFNVSSETILRNKLRAAEIWMDEYKEIVYDLIEPAGGIDLGPLDYMRGIRKKLNCKPFQWLLDNVYPEAEIPFALLNALAKGEIRNPATNACFDTLGPAGVGTDVGVYPCHGQKGTQFFVLTTSNQIRIPASDFQFCLDNGKDSTAISSWHCHNSGGPQHWHWDELTGRLSDASRSRCAEVSPTPTDKSPFSLSVKPCADVPEQVWRISMPIAPK